MNTFSSIIRFAATGAIIASSFAAKASSIEPTANSKALVSFENYFGNATQVKWFTIGTDKLEAKFMVNNVSETAFFDTRGNLLEVTRPIQVSDLPIQISLEMTREFPSSAVRYATEFSSGNSTVYVLILESSSDWKTVRVNNNKDFTLINDLKKIFIR
ncbi:MAG TPA: hypothetical protein VMV20_01450 [Chitinophagaceae bacterium]|nr:hypothetical protein [Chitinophagaceae bacterium]